MFSLSLSVSFSNKLDKLFPLCGKKEVINQCSQAIFLYTTAESGLSITYETNVVQHIVVTIAAFQRD